MISRKVAFVRDPFIQFRGLGAILFDYLLFVQMEGVKYIDRGSVEIYNQHQ